MSLLYWTMLPWLCAAPLAPPSAEDPRPLLLLAAPGQPSLEQRVVEQALLLELLAGHQVRLVADAPVSASLRTAASLRRDGAAQLARGWARMRDLHPEAAAACAAMATQKFARVAARTGDVGPLVDGLALQAAAYLHAGAPGAAGRVLAQLLALRPDWAPAGWLYNPDMQRAVARARRTLQGLPRRPTKVLTASRQAAVFVDGAFVGFGDATVELTTQLPHYVWVLPRCGEPVGTRLVVPAADRELEPTDPAAASTPAPADAPAPALHVHLRPHPGVAAASDDDPQHRYASVFAAARASDGLVEPSLPALAAASVRDVWVLAYGHGKLSLTCFDLASGRRQLRERTAVVTTLAEGRELAQALLPMASEGERGPPGPSLRTGAARGPDVDPGAEGFPAGSVPLPRLEPVATRP